MQYHETELKNAITKLDRLLKKYPDAPLEIIVFKQYLKGFLRIKTNSITLPTSEVMAIIKHEKPETYYYLKKNSKNEPLFHFLTNINMDYERARQNLQEIKDVIS